MPRLAANLTMLFNEWPFLDRFEAAARAGFEGVEFLFPYEHPPEAVAGALREAGLSQALFNLPAGDWQAGERGTAALPGREREFALAAEQALDYARASGCRRLHAMAGIPAPGADPGECERHEPDSGEVNYCWLLAMLDELGYDGWVGCEYRPRAGTLEGLGWAAEYGILASGA